MIGGTLPEKCFGVYGFPGVSIKGIFWAGFTIVQNLVIEI